MLLEAESVRAPCNPQTLARSQLVGGDELLLGEMIVSKELVEHKDEPEDTGKKARKRRSLQNKCLDYRLVQITMCVFCSRF